MQFTPTEERILKVLADGDKHGYDDLMKCINDELSSRENLRNHIARLRKKIRLEGHEIICELYDRARYYRLILPTVFNKPFTVKISIYS